MDLELEVVSFPFNVGNMLELALTLVSNLGSSSSLSLATSGGFRGGRGGRPPPLISGFEFLLSSSFPLSPSNPELGEYNEGGPETKEKLCSYLH